MNEDPVAIDLVRASPVWKHERSVERLVRSGVRAAFAAAELQAAPGAELAIVLSDNAGVRELNRTWRGKDVPTNVLTFPAAAPDEITRATLLGDIVLAFETIVAEAEAEGKTMDDHLVHLVVHGVLHLYGFDHMTEAEAEAMEATERKALASLGIADPYAVPSRVGGSAATHSGDD
jgi:probable rRNA maturation factor